MLKCNVCGTEFPAIKENRYTARDEGKTGLATAFGSVDEEKQYDAFDCPFCGCQHIAQERKRELVLDEPETDDEE